MERKDHMKTVRGIAKAGAILLRITQVFAIIGAVFCLIGMILLAALPPELIRIQTREEVTVNVDLRNYVSAEDWKKIEPSLENALENEKEVMDFSILDRFLVIRTAKARTMERGDLALYIAPSILVLALAWSFCGTLRKMLVNIRNGLDPFLPENASCLKTCGIIMLVGAVVPAIVVGIIGLFAEIKSGYDVNSGSIFGGLMLLGLAALFNAVAANRPETPPPAVPAPGGYPPAPPAAPYSGNAPLPPPPPMPPQGQAPAPEQTPAPQEEPHDPNAF